MFYRSRVPAFLRRILEVLFCGFEVEASERAACFAYQDGVVKSMGRQPTRAPESQLHLPPGFRFYPTDEELVVDYLCRRAADSQPFAVPIIAEVDLYKCDPWDLPDKALFGEKEWYFFSPRDRKYPNGSRPNRAAGSGFWKATGTDKPISTGGGTQKVGVKKALVFYKGRAPKGVKTNWIMHEYRLVDTGNKLTKKKGSLRLDDWVLCRIYKKNSSAQKAAKGQSEFSCIDDVLASLPDIDDTKPMNLPRLNSLKGFPIEQDVKPNLNLFLDQTIPQNDAKNSQAQFSGCEQITMLHSSGYQPRLDGMESLPNVQVVPDHKSSFRSDERKPDLDCVQSLLMPRSSVYGIHSSCINDSRQHSPSNTVEEDSEESAFSPYSPLFSQAASTGFLQYTDSFPYNFDCPPASFGRLEPLTSFVDTEYFSNMGEEYMQKIM